MLRDDDVERSIAAAVRLWWGSGVRGRRFVQLVHQAREITQERISLGRVERGEPGRREAAPYFLAVLCDLVSGDRLSRTRLLEDQPRGRRSRPTMLRTD